MKQVGRVYEACLWTGVIVGSLLFALVLSHSLLIETGRIPDTVVQSASDVSSTLPKKLTDWGVLEEGESLEYYYTTGSFSYKKDGYLFTKDRVITYKANDETKELEVQTASWDQISELDFTPEDTPYEDSLVTVIKSDGGWFVLYLSNENDMDERFFRELEALWQAHRETK